VLFAAFLGYNPMQHLLGSSRTLISGPFHHGLIIVFTVAAARPP
jgi:hypothetical protein